MVLAAAGGHLNAGGHQQNANTAADSIQTQRALINRYCVSCHNDKSKTGGLALDQLDLSNIARHAEVWEKVARKLRGGVMPPPGRPRPDRAAYEGLLSWVETELDRAASLNPNPGRKQTFHRLNRVEYGNAIRDLLAVEVDIASMLPADDASYGFDNMASSLRISQSALEQYMSAARRVSRIAVGTPPPAPLAEDFRVPPDARQYERIEGLPFGTRGGLMVRYLFPQDGEYEFEIELMCDATDCDGASGFPDTHELEVAVDGTRIELFRLEPRQTARPKAERAFRVRVPVTAGPHEVGVAFLALPYVKEVDQRVSRNIRPYFGYGSAGLRTYQPYIGRVTIKGPFNAAGPGETPSRQRIFACQPASSTDEPACARRILSALARRAYRRPASESDVESLLAFYKEGRTEGGFEKGIEIALRRLLVSPAFLFRIERDPAGIAPNTNYRLDDLELASRLSFFLWSSIPDERLIDLAAAGRLKDRTVLQGEVRRMLADERARALVDSFAAQWLELRNVAAASPSLPLYPEFGADLRRAFRRETALFVESIIREDRSTLELLTADYTFLNERLARHYGIPNVFGDDFRRVRLTDENRRGLLGHGSILLVTSRPNRTSPVLRGKWILENVLGTPPPPPPANVPPLPERKIGSQAKVLSMREQMAAHRENPVCASCHSMIDPVGFAFENYDAIGRWRAIDEAYQPIVTSGALPDGTKFENLAQFRAALVSSPQRFVTTLAEKLLTFALGRGVEAYDMPAVRRVVRDAQPGGYKVSDLVIGIVESVPFQMRRSAPSGDRVAAKQQ